MEQGKSKVSLPDLPPSHYRFWDKADKHRIELVKQPRCKHYFEYRRGSEIVCKKCSMGYYLTGKEYVKSGKIELRT
jgi:hypothetical protein